MIAPETQSDITKLRAANRDAVDGIARSPLPAPPGTVVVVARNVDDGDFPAAAARVYILRRLKALVRNTEGDTPSWTAYGPRFAAANIGPNIPSIGADVLAYSTPGGFVFHV